MTTTLMPKPMEELPRCFCIPKGAPTTAQTRLARGKAKRLYISTFILLVSTEFWSRSFICSRSSRMVNSSGFSERPKFYPASASPARPGFGTSWTASSAHPSKRQNRAFMHDPFLAVPIGPVSLFDALELIVFKFLDSNILQLP